MSMTSKNNLFDAISASLKAAMQPSNNEVAPIAIVWTDTDGQWLPLMSTLRGLMPTLFTLGEYDSANRTGPAIWLKCIVDRVLPEAPPEGAIPVLYLPRVSRQELRAAGDCPPALEPLVELQYRGRVWHQSNGQDWTVRAFLVSDEGLGLDVAGDRRTEEAFLRSLPLLAGVDIKSLKGKRLDADDFDRLSIQDPVRDLLMWLNNAETFEASAKGGRWESFSALCQSEFGLNPNKVSPAEVAGQIINADLKLDRVWQRFLEAPQLYSGVAGLLRNPVGTGQGLLVLDPSRDPRANERDEIELRKNLEAAAGLAHAAASARVLELEAQHAARRHWVWARIGQAAWAKALRPLAKLATAAKAFVGGANLTAAAAEYATKGWECDGYAMEALACFHNGPDAVLMTKIVRTLYEPWLDGSARHFQSLVAQVPSEARQAVGKSTTDKDTCVLFVDGLRFDLAGKLAAKLEEHSFRVNLSHRLSPLPTVTATAKVVASSIVDSIRGGNGEDFAPLIQVKAGWRPLNAALLRECLEGTGVEFLDSNENRIPSGSNNGGWTECGKIDSHGHSLQADLVHQLEAELDRIAERVKSLLGTGWRRIRIVTDHGWLLLPGGLPKVDLPIYLVETKWARCAVVKGEPNLNVPVSAWYWNADVRIASPPGIACFNAGNSYAHGGISPQECVVPEILIEPGASSVYATIKSVEWRAMRCRVNIESNDPKVRVDLRTNWKQESSSIVATVKEVGVSGEVSLAVADDAFEGAAATVVALDIDGKVITTQTTCVGEQI